MNVEELSRRPCGCTILYTTAEAVLPCNGHRDAVMAAIQDPETALSPASRRRLATARRALQVRVMDEPKSLEEADARMEAIADGIRALQSLDDLGEEMNAAAARDEGELSLRYGALRKIREKMAEWKKR